MTRFRRALAATTMAVAAAGGGLLIAAAGTVPAYASASPGGHTITMTAHRTAGAASRIGPHEVLPCAKKPGVAPATCGDGDTVSCTMSAGRPSVNFTTRVVSANAIVQCTEEVASIRLTEHLLQDGVAVSTDSVTELDSQVAVTQVSAICQGGAYINVVDATITPANGYVLTGGPNIRHFESAPLSVPSFGCSTSGGGGGCALPAPSLAGHPAGRHPDFISCG
jgi:hypothetical protein